MIEKALAFLKQYEGFTPVAKWDVNAFRIGYGSDTITDPNGSVRYVQINDQITQVDADRDLRRRVQYEFIPKIIGKLGSDVWNKLPTNTQVALISFAYNYGNIVKSAIVAAAKEGDLNKLADVWISSTWNDNASQSEKVKNALRARRKKESDLIRSDAKQTPSIILPVILIIAGITLLTR